MRNQRKEGSNRQAQGAGWSPAPAPALAALPRAIACNLVGEGLPEHSRCSRRAPSSSAPGATGLNSEAAAAHAAPSSAGSEHADGSGARPPGAAPTAPDSRAIFRRTVPTSERHSAKGGSPR
jgi:hypothetical protein